MSYLRLINKGISQTSVGLTEEFMVYPSLTLCAQFGSMQDPVTQLEEAYQNRIPMDNILLSIKHQYEGVEE